MSNEQLKNDLVEVINRHISNHDLHPQAAAKILLEMVPEVIEHLDWVPSDVRAGVDLAKRAGKLV